MTTANLRLVPRNFHDEATLTNSITPATGFPVTNTQNSTRSLVWKSTGTTAQTIKGTLAASRSATFFGMFRHAMSGGSVRIQLFSDAAWTTQTYDSTALPVNNITPTDVYDWGIGSNDPFAGTWPYWIWFASAAFQSYTISFSGSPTIGYWQASRIWLGKHLEVTYNPAYGATLGFLDQSDRDRSRSGSLRTRVGPTWRTMDLTMGEIDESQRAAFLDILQYCGTSRDVVASLFPLDGTRLERDHIINGKFSNMNALGRQVSYLTGHLQLEEV
jgi:hypothetical protein